MEMQLIPSGSKIASPLWERGFPHAGLIAQPFFVLHFVVDAVVVVDAVARIKQGLRFGDILVQQR